jgi:hypothetical protein
VRHQSLLESMCPRDGIELPLLGVLWGGAYLVTRAALAAFGPAPLVSLRLGIAALILLPIVFCRGGWSVGASRTRRKMAGIDPLVTTAGSLALAGAPCGWPTRRTRCTTAPSRMEFGRYKAPQPRSACAEVHGGPTQSTKAAPHTDEPNLADCHGPVIFSLHIST